MPVPMLMPEPSETLSRMTKNASQQSSMYTKSRPCSPVPHTWKGSSRLADDDIERMVKEAETFATADKERRENINIKNEADSLAYQASKQLETLGDKISTDEKKEIEDKD